MYLIGQHSRLMTSETQSLLNKEIMSRRFFDETFAEIKKIVGTVPKATDTDFECYKDMIDSFEAACGRTSDYGLKYFRVFYDTCANANSDKMAVKLHFSQKCLNKEFA